MQTQSIKHNQLKLLVAENGIRDVTISGTAGGFLLHVTTRAGTDVLLHTNRDERPRVFKKSDAVLSYLKGELGIGRATVRMDTWNPDQQAIV